MADTRSESQDPAFWDSAAPNSMPASFWDSLNDADQGALASISHPTNFSSGRLVIRKGMPNDRVIIIRTGTVETTTVDTDGREEPWFLYGPGDVLGYLPALIGESLSENGIALTEVNALTVSDQRFSDFLAHHPAASRALLQSLARQLRHAARHRMHSLPSEDSKQDAQPSSEPVPVSTPRESDRQLVRPDQLMEGQSSASEAPSGQPSLVNSLQFRLLGPVEVYSNGQRIDLGYAKSRLLLALLLIADNRPVSVDILIGRLWDEDPPGAARSQLHSYISHLRRSLAMAAPNTAVPLRHEMGGYLLRFDPEQVDLHRFRRLVRQGQALVASNDDVNAARLLREALSLWNDQTGREGEPLTGIPGSYILAYRNSLQAEHQAAFLIYLETELRLGNHRRAIGDLAHFARSNPYDEHFARLLMLAHYRNDQQAEALNSYHQLRKRLNDDLGIEPSKAVRRLYELILQQDPILDSTEAAVMTNAPHRHSPT